MIKLYVRLNMVDHGQNMVRLDMVDHGPNMVRPWSNSNPIAYLTTNVGHLTLMFETWSTTFLYHGLNMVDHVSTMIQFGRVRGY